MKRLFIILVLLLLAGRGSAQSLQPVDMPFNIQFTPLGDSPPAAAGLFGSASYYRLKSSFFPGLPAYTNHLEVDILLPAAPLATWIYEKQANGLFTPVVEVTNLIDDGGGLFSLNPFFTLTTNQIHSLVAGNWFVGVDFGASNYLGNLAPQYDFATGPQAMMVFPPLANGFVSDGYQLIAPDNRKIKVVLDGSHCRDPFYLPMEYNWQGWAGYTMDGTPVFTATNMMATNVFAVGSYTIQLQANDVIHDGQPFYFYVVVQTAAQAVSGIIENLKYSAVPPNKQALMVGVLTRAARAFKQGEMGSGVNSLKEFERLVKKLNFDSRSTAYFLKVAQDIIDALKPPAH
jgi:hypothetical protein